MGVVIVVMGYFRVLMIDTDRCDGIVFVGESEIDRRPYTIVYVIHFICFDSLCLI